MGALDIALFHEDALANHFQVILPAWPGVLNIEQTTIRILNCSIPEDVINTYDITKNGQTAKRPSGIEGIDKTFSFTYRADKYWQVYKGITAWMNFIRGIRTGSMGLDAIPLSGGPSTFRFPISIQTIDSNGVLTGGSWTFEGAWPTGNGSVDFDENNGDPIEITATFDFLYPNYPTV